MWTEDPCAALSVLDIHFYLELIEYRTTTPST